MKKIFLLCFFCTYALASFAQKETFDLVTYTPPGSWSRDVTETITSFTTINKKNNSWCRINIVKSTVSKGSIEQDFESEWQNLIIKNYNPSGAPQLNEIQDANGWKIKNGAVEFTFNNSPATALLTTMSGFERCISIVVTTNSQDYIKDIEAFLASVSLIKPEVVPQQTYGPPGILPAEKQKEPAKQTVTQPNPPAANSGFAFASTNFDDGWTSTVQEDWVEATKGNIKVLLHYSNAVTGKYYSDSDEGINAAWNNLVAPRYNDLQNYTAWYSTSILPRPYVIAGNVTDKQSGEKVYIVLFQKGNTGWIEIISPDKNTFVNNFEVDNTTLNNYPDLKLFAALEKLATYNKFAIAATDLKGKWSDKFSASFFNYSTSDGQYTGTNTIAIVSNFIFTSATEYNWDAYSTNNAHSAGAAKTFKTKGSFKMINNWQIHFSDIQRKPKTYNAYFSCFKGGRILWLQDIDYGGYNSFGKIE